MRRYCDTTSVSSKYGKFREGLVHEGDDSKLLSFVADSLSDWDTFIKQVEYLYQHPEEKESGTLSSLNRAGCCQGIPALSGWKMANGLKTGGVLSENFYCRMITGLLEFA